MVPEVGLEPTRLTAHDFESRSSANSDTLAYIIKARIIINGPEWLVKDGGYQIASRYTGLIDDMTSRNRKINNSTVNRSPALLIKR